MNPNIVKMVAAALAGAAVGGVATFFVTRNITNKKNWADMDEEIRAAEERIMKRYKVGPWGEIMKYAQADAEATVELVKGAPLGVVTDVRVNEDGSLDVVGQLNGLGMLVQKANEAEVGPLREAVAEAVDDETLRKLKDTLESHGYANTFEDLAEEDDPADEGVEEVVSVTPNMDDLEPYLISEAEFFQDNPEYMKISLSYYEGDQVVCDEQESIVDDVESTIGRANLEGFSDENTTLYVRNNRLKVDIEISLELGKFSEAVLGVEAPVERRRRRPHLEE